MSITAYKPTTAGRRGMTSQDLSQITAKKPIKSLLVVKKQNSGRNNQGRITVRHRGGGVKKFVRIVNYKLPEGTKAVIEAIEYDPNRSARLARIKDEAGKYHYIIAGKGFAVGQTIVSGEGAPIADGNRMKLKDMPVGSIINSIEITRGKGAQMVRSAGNSAQLMSKDGAYAQIKLPSGEIRLINQENTAALGVVGNEQHQNIKWGKAGRIRNKGRRPQVRGIVMNAVDHPHGGGDGGSHGVGRNPKTPWGIPTLGYKTRKRKSTSKFIVRSRHAAKRK